MSAVVQALIGSSVAPAGGIAIVQSASGTTADGSAGLTVPFGAAVVAGAGTAAANGTYTYRGIDAEGQPIFVLTGQVLDGLKYALAYRFGSWTIYNSTGADALYIDDNAPSPSLPWLAGMVWVNVTGANPAPTVTCSSPVTAGNSVIALVSWAGGGLSVSPTIVGGGNVEMTEEVTEAASVRTRICSLHNVASGVTGVTCSTNGAARASMQPIEASGVADAAATDTDANSGTSATASLAGLSGDGLAVVTFAVANATNPFNEGTLTAGWTSLGVTGGNGVWQMSAYRIDGANAVSVGLTGSLDWASAGAVFAAA